MSKNPILTTSSGAPVADNQNSITAGPLGPVLMQDFHLLEKLAHQNRERIPERTVHAKGSAAYGTLTITNDISRYTRASVFSAVGKKTEVLGAGKVFAIYPEGTRTRDGLLHRGHTGIARLALRCNVPIVPIGLIGTDDVQPVDSRMPKLFRVVTIRFGEPVDGRAAVHAGNL